MNPEVPVSDAHTAVRSLKGRRAVVTGGTTGIGRAIAVLLAAEGARVFIGGSDPDHLADALVRIGQVGEGSGATIDLTEPGAPARFIEEGVAALGGIDIAVMNAATAAEGLSDMSAGAIEQAIALDFTAYLMGAKAASERMGQGGDLVLIGSMSAHVLGPGSTVYAGIKAGIAGLSEALRRELGPKGIRVALVEPGKTGSDMQMPDVSPEEQRRQIADETMLRAEDIAVGVQYLLTQPTRTVVQQLVIVPRAQPAE
ncbi:SDR family oxidoreductase [Sphingomonas sp. 1P08PE]|uniref:SDR family oxidoreductase n=1 Tax=Sphingomonas sp. 1P08PE TaxID=554122 RepID=UPI0039A0860D